MQEKRAPLLEKRAKIIKGDISDFADYIPAFDTTVTEITQIVAGIVKTEEDIEAEKEETPHEPTNVDHLKTV